MSSSTFRRRLHGVLLLDKPLGLSSNQALQRAKRLYRADKAGHTGSLDPLATGMLPICFGEATKLAGVLLGGRKAYTALVCLGEARRGDDLEGEVIAEAPVPELDSATLQACLERFVGAIDQVPPAHSALKVDGQRAYTLARSGVALDLPARPVEIYRIDLLAQRGPQIELRVECGAGTYIRSLARDLGLALGTVAHLAGLRRLWVEPFEGLDCQLMDQLEAAGDARDGLLLSPAQALSHWPQFRADPAAVADLRQGRRVATALPEGRACALDSDGRLVALGAVSDEGWFQPQRVLLPDE